MPGRGSADSVAEFSWLNCSIAAGAASVSMRTRAERGTIDPSAARTKNSCQSLRIQAIVLPHLTDDIIAAVIAVELRDRRAANQRAERGADLADRYTERCRPVAIHDDAGARRLVGDRVWTTMNLPEAVAFAFICSPTS